MRFCGRLIPNYPQRTGDVNINGKLRPQTSPWLFLLLLLPYCPTTAALLCCYCCPTVLLLLPYCPATAALLSCYCCPTVLLLLPYCPATAALMCCYCCRLAVGCGRLGARKAEMSPLGTGHPPSHRAFRLLHSAQNRWLSSLQAHHPIPFHREAVSLLP